MRSHGGRRLTAAYLVCAVLALLPAAVPAAARAGEGGLDTSFGAGGWSSTPPGTLQGPKQGVELGVGPDGSAFVAEMGGSIVRFGPEGSRDTGFGEGGELLFAQDPAAEGVSARAFVPKEIAVDGQGRLLVFGGETDSRRTYNPNLVSAGPVPLTRGMVLRYDGSGRLDPSFGGGKGFVRSTFGLQPEQEAKVPIVDAMAGTVDSRDRPVLIAGTGSVVGGCIGHSGYGFLPRAVVRLTESGSLDTSFGGSDGAAPLGGTASFPLVTTDAADQPIAEVGATGNSRQKCGPSTTLVHLRANGARLRGFGSRGTLRLSQLRLALAEPSEALLVDREKQGLLELARLRPNGKRAQGFGDGGIAKVHLPSRAAVKPVAIDGSGRILLAGYVGGNHGSIVVGRLLPDGKQDPGFGEGGWLVSATPEAFEIGSTAAALDPQGRLVVAAAGTAAGQKNAYLLARFLLGP
jgi:uncharacterized delta-60 repeat protein